MEKIGKIGALLQKGTKIVPQRALFYGPSNGALRAPFQYRLFFSVNFNCEISKFKLRKIHWFFRALLPISAKWFPIFRQCSVLQTWKPVVIQQSLLIYWITTSYLSSWIDFGCYFMIEKWLNIYGAAWNISLWYISNFHINWNFTWNISYINHVWLRWHLRPW